VRLEGRAEIRAPRSAVWALLVDPVRVVPCLPGSPLVEPLEGGRFRARAKVRVGFLSAPIAVDLEYVDLHEPNEATVRAHGTGPGSHVDVTATMVLTDGAHGASVVDWTAEIEVAGLLASLGAAQVEETAGRVIAEVLGCAGRRLEA
jgi:carbon monoxide dehydrogenase subunit G